MRKSWVAVAIALAFTASGSAIAADSAPIWADSEMSHSIAGQGKAPMGLNELMADQIKPAKLDELAKIPTIRAEAIQEAAASLGARAGMARWLHDMAVALEKHEHSLKIYDFEKLALSVPVNSGRPMTPPNPKTGNGEYAMILPPVLLEGRDADSFLSPDEMRIADRFYKIHAKARLIPVDKASGKPAVPHWRDYLTFAFEHPSMPHASLLPKNDAEKTLWNEWVKKGWDEGVEQGKSMFDAGFARLERDFHGMLKYRLAYAQGVITRPLVAGQKLGVTGGGMEMWVGDRIVRITDHSSLVADQARWIEKEPK